MPALIRKMHEARERNDPKVVVWGTGSPRRELLYSDDMAEACLFLMGLEDAMLGPLLSESHPPLINIGYGEDLTIRELAELIRDVVGFKGELEFDPTKPDGTPQKWLDGSRLNQLGWKPKIALKEGLTFTYLEISKLL